MPNGLGGAVAGALANGMLSWMGAQDTPVNLSDTFVVPMVVYKSASLKSPDGITMTVGDQLMITKALMDYNLQEALQAQPLLQVQVLQVLEQLGNVLYNPQALSATLGQVEQRELDLRTLQK